MKIGIVGLGKMGQQIANRLMLRGHDIVGYDPHVGTSTLSTVQSLEELVKSASIIWLMVPHSAVDEVLKIILTNAIKPLIIIDGGNSNFHDTIRRAETCQSNNISYIDVGVSGGVIATQGFCLMIGGDENIVNRLQPIWQALSAPEATIYCGPSGSGHYVKMIHNGIEYGLLQAYAEGIMMLHEGPIKPPNITGIITAWNKGSLISSKLLELFKDALELPILHSMSGRIAESGMGAWMADEAYKSKIPTPVLHAALHVRALSRKSGGNFGTKLIALVRYIFGGHTVEKL
jgi:6-phosphogluconate dehydrogenase